MKVAGEAVVGVWTFCSSLLLDPGMVTLKMVRDGKRIRLFAALVAALFSAIATAVAQSVEQPVIRWIAVRQGRQLAFSPPAKPSQMMHAAPSPELSLFEVIAVCQAAPTNSSWNCEEIRSGQYRTARSYGSAGSKVHLVVEAIGFGSTPRASLGADLPGEALVFRLPLCKQNFGLDRCKKGQQTAGELFEFDLSGVLKNQGVRSFEASSVDVNHPSNLQKTRLVIGE